MGKEPSGFSKGKRLGWGRTEDRAPIGAVAAEMKVALHQGSGHASREKWIGWRAPRS